MDSLAQSLAQAITVLFAGGSWTSEQKYAANAYILDVNTRKESFVSILQLLMAPSEPIIVKFFACNLLHDKVRKQWSTLADQEKAEVVEKLSYLISNLPSASSSDTIAYRRKIISAFCSTCLHLEGGLSTAHVLIASLLSAANLQQFTLAVDILTQLNDEADIVDMSRQSKSDLILALTQALDSFLPVIATHCEHLPGQVLEYLCSCCKVHTVTLALLATQHPQFLQLLSTSLLSELLVPACSLVRELAVMRAFPPSTACSKALEQMAGQLVHAAQALMSRPPQEDHLPLVELTQTIVLVLSINMEAILEEDGIYRRLTSALLQLVASKPRANLLLTFDLWSEFENFPQRDHFNEAILPEIFRLILQHAAVEARSSDEDSEDWEAFRDLRLGLDEMLGMIVDGMPDRFVQIVAQTLQGGSWQAIEVSLFVLYASMGYLKPHITHGPSPSEEVLGFLRTTSTDLLRYPTTQGVLVETACHYLGSLAFCCTDGALYEQMVEYLLRCAVSHGSSSSGNSSSSGQSPDKISLAGAKAFHRLALHGHMSHALLSNCISFFTQAIGKESMLLLVEALTRVSLSSEHSASLLPALAHPAITAIYTQQSVQQTEYWLTYLSQLIRFCDVPDQQTPHPLLPLIQQLWPCLTQIIQTDWNAVNPLVEKVFEIYGRTLASLGSSVSEQLSAVEAAIHHAVVHRMQATASALDCAMHVVDFITNYPPEGMRRAMLVGFIGPLVATVQAYLQGTLATETELFLSITYQQLGYDIDAIDNLARLILTCLTSPAARCVFTEPGLVEGVLAIMMTIIRCATEKDPLRNVHVVLQSIFAPAKLSISSDADQTALLIRCKPYGAQLVMLLVQEVTSSRLGAFIVTNVSDALHAVLCAFAVEECQQWLHAAIAVSAQLPLDQSARQRLAQCMLMLATYQNRRFKALVMDVYKVCNGESAVDVLVAYEDVLL